MRWRVMPDREGARLEVELVGPVFTEHVRVVLSVESAEQLAHDLQHVAAGQGSGSAGPRSGSDLEARN